MLELENRGMITAMDNKMKLFYDFEHVLKYAGPALQYSCEISRMKGMNPSVKYLRSDEFY